MSLPITVRCECGETVSAELGDIVTCACGRRYDTTSIGGEKLARVRAAKARITLYLRVATIFLVGMVVVAGVLYQGRGVAIAIPAAAAVWFWMISPRYKRRYLTDLSEMPSWDLKASDDGSARPG